MFNVLLEMKIIQFSTVMFSMLVPFTMVTNFIAELLYIIILYKLLFIVTGSVHWPWKLLMGYFRLG